ncbi:MAG: SMC family ATPase, partial [Candidatus Nanopelagicales bacterium]
MRLHHLSLDAFGPYATVQDVDFDQLSASGLFLLEGPTGAGKSTVLDAVTFALYGELSAETSARDRLHSDFAAPGRTPTVTLEWSVRGRRLRITRVPEHERPSKRKGGAPVKESSTVHLEQLEDGAWVSLCANKAETGQLVTELMGLNRAQFTQVVLLPQGEFARFLRADDDTRRELLTKLFGTHLYDRVTAELEDRRHDAQSARSEAQHHVEQALAAAGQAAGLDAEARAALVALDPTDLSVALEDIGKRLAGADQDAQVTAELARGR